MTQKNKAEQEEELGKTFKKLRNKHSAVESDINRLEHHGLSIPDDEIDPLINKIRTDGWQAYKTVTKDLGLAHNRAVLKDQKDALKLLPLET